jgi:ribonuclease HII
LADAKERQQLAENELNLLQIQDARELDPATKAELAEKIKAKENEVPQTRAATEEAQKNLENLQNEFKASGAPDEWSETEIETSE